MVAVENEVVALRETDDEVAAFREQRLTHEARRLRKPGIFERKLQLVRDQFGDPVFKTLPRLVGEGQIGRIAADPEDFAVDQIRTAGFGGLAEAARSEKRNRAANQPPKNIGGSRCVHPQSARSRGRTKSRCAIVPTSL